MTENETESNERKPCRYCAEPMKSTARLCPHCGHAQKGIFLPPDAIVMVFACVCALGTIWLCVNLPGGSRDFAKDRSKLVVLNSRLNVDDSKQKRVTLSGIITNQSNHAWSDLEFDVRFYDTNGALIDVFESAHHDFTVERHDEHSFGFELKNYKIKSGYATHQVLVRSGQERERDDE